MEVTETTSEGLKRELKVTIEADELNNRLSERLGELKNRIRLKGFRPGKVPIEHLRKVYGRSVMAEVLEQAISEGTRQAIAEREERPAMEPDISVPEDTDEIEKVIAGEEDLAYTISFEVLPEIDIADLDKIELEKLVADVSDEEVENAIQRLLQGSATYEKKDGKAEEGDQVTIDYEGSVDGEKFEGGTAQDAPVVVGSGQFLPGFDEGLIGVKSGETRTIKCTFPEQYPVAQLAGKEASFEVAVKEVAAPSQPELDEDFAKRHGFDTVAGLREAVQSKLAEEYESVSRERLKRDLLDELDKTHKFELPATLLEREFEGIWQRVTSELEQTGRTFADEGTTEEKAREEYRSVAERRVRLGLVLSEIGQKNDIKLSDDEVSQAVMERARQFPGQEREVFEYYQKNPEALAELRVPLFENKVVDYILERANVKEKKVGVDELLERPEGDS